MGTRGLIGIRNNKKLLIGRYNHYDSYYTQLGKEVICFYFNGSGKRIIDINLIGNQEDDRKFLQDGLFCQYAYVYNEDNDTLEIYRGFFKDKQGFNTKTKIINSLKDKKEEYFCHLIIIVDRKKHTKKQVLKAFKKYDDIHNEEEVGENYPERKIIPLEINEDYIPIV